MHDRNVVSADFARNKDGDYSKDQFLALADRLLAEGRRPEQVFLAMYQAAVTRSLEHSIGEHLIFMKVLKEDVDEYLPLLETHVGTMAEEGRDIWKR